MNKILQSLFLTGCVALATLQSAADAATAYTTVQGALAPGVYGRIDIGNAPPPPLIYTQPIIIQRAPQRVLQEPLYLHVPPGHAKKWSKHCAKYNACNQPVYFVRVRGDDHEQRGQGGRQDAYRGYEEQRGGGYENLEGGKHGKHGKDKDKEGKEGKHRKGHDKE